MKARALIAEDEPLLAATLAAELLALWPALAVVASVGDGEAALARTLELAPDVVFLDIRMPGLNGLETARALAEDWPESGRPFPLIVFVTAYDQYALDAFERAAVDYVLKPVDSQRLATTCARVQAALAVRSARTATGGEELGGIVEQLRGLLGTSERGVLTAPPTAAAPLQVIQAAVGSAIHLVPVGEVVYFEAADKYVRVLTVEREHLIRTSLRELVPLLDPARFWQVHRGTVVRADAIASALRDEAGKLSLVLRGRPERLAVSRLYAHVFKAM